MQFEFGEVRKRTYWRNRRLLIRAIQGARVATGISAGVIISIFTGGCVNGFVCFGAIVGSSVFNGSGAGSCAIGVIRIGTTFDGNAIRLIEGVLVEDEASGRPGVHEIVLFGEQAVARRDETTDCLGERGVIVDLVTRAVAELLDRIGQKQTSDGLEFGEANARAQLSQADDNGHRRIRVDVESTG
ncbi:MAG TPA: hypothetical protein GX718_14780 [Brevibacterium sp.]|uniref:Uncharacterized protein n=1 Tax=Brevibacterium epidermidis TaxID=1698 RepID=A0A9D2ZWW0_BREEP|nr:hypothetical protein [Brevibacterium sp.]HJE78238.1 hypothetical protein [Brevibacterium epidermidis]